MDRRGAMVVIAIVLLVAATGTFPRLLFSADKQQVFKDHACIGCHQISEGGRLVGGPQSTYWD